MSWFNDFSSLFLGDATFLCGQLQPSDVQQDLPVPLVGGCHRDGYFSLHSSPDSSVYCLQHGSNARTSDASMCVFSWNNKEKLTGKRQGICKLQRKAYGLKAFCLFTAAENFMHPSSGHATCITRKKGSYWNPPVQYRAASLDWKNSKYWS